MFAKQTRQARTAIRDGLRKGRDREGAKLAHQLRLANLTYLDMSALLDLRRRVRDADDLCIPGVLIEAGCALGGSAILMARSRRTDRELYVYDVFGTIPAPGERDGEDVHARYEAIARGDAHGLGGDRYYGYQANLREQVELSFERFHIPPGSSRVHLVEGLFQDTLRPNGAVAIAHIDGDWYDSVKVCLDRIWPVLSVNGVLVIDDYEAWTGCRRAVDDFCGDHQGELRSEMWSRLHIVKTRAT